ncbi:PQQ-dependent sugar dehydrogenase [bacterium]|nr:PQQ-dependent sugar dehydrogenase [bacterium]
MRKNWWMAGAALIALIGCQPPQFSKPLQVLDWPGSRRPYAPSGFRVESYATGLDHPANLLVADNGDVLVAESQGITLLRDANGDGHPELRTSFLSGLYRPYGMAMTREQFLVANTDGVYSYPYKPGHLRPGLGGKRILQLPTQDQDRHWQRNLLLDEAHQKLYVTVGSASDAGEGGMEKEYRRANVLELDLQTGAERVYASGLRNPLGLDWATSGQLWTVVSEGNQQADYFTSIQDGAFYGWPYTYPNTKVMEAPAATINKAQPPDLALKAEAGSGGLRFYRADSFPRHYRDGAFISQHGVDSRSNLNGFKVVFVPFKQGLPSGPPEDFLAGFVPDYASSQVYGRPSAVAVGWDGALLVADDAGNRVWRVSR